MKPCIRLLLSLLVALPMMVSGALPENVQFVFDAAGLDDQQIARVAAGEVVAAEGKDFEPTESALTLIVLLSLDAEVPAVARALEQTLDGAIANSQDSAPIEEGAAFPALRYVAGEEQEARRLLQFRGGGQFNMSSAEIQMLEAAASGRGDELERASAVMNEILERRYRAYLDRGLDGIEPYQRGQGKTSSAAEELRLLDEDIEKYLAPVIPRFVEATNASPRQLADVEYEYHVVKKLANKRPSFALTGRAIAREPTATTVAQYEFYSAHTYNSLHSLVVLVPWDGRTLVLLSTDAYTDKVTGAMSGIAKPVGRKQVQKSVQPLIDSMRANLAAQ